MLLPGELVKLPRKRLSLTRISKGDPPAPHHIVDALQESCQQYIASGAALLFSGGLDSSILAVLSDAVLITCGLEGCQDLVFSRKAARLLGKELVEVVISEKDIKNAIPQVRSFIDEKTLLNVEIGLLLFFVCQEWDKKIVISGQGADELFGGYYKYEKAYQKKEDVKTIMRNDVNALHHGLERDHQIAERFSKTIRYPYLDVDVVKKALGIPAEQLFTPQRKGFLRTVAAQLSLPEDIVTRPKKALQYGTGIHKIVKKMYVTKGGQQKEAHP
jgi:asparagine synthase (glutamine-hydrolysing)